MAEEEWLLSGHSLGEGAYSIYNTHTILCKSNYVDAMRLRNIRPSHILQIKSPRGDVGSAATTMADLAHAPSGPSGSGGSAQALRGERPQPSGTVHASFLPAGQSDMIRAAQKDDYFVQVCLSPPGLAPAPKTSHTYIPCTLSAFVTLCSTSLSAWLARNAPWRGKKRCVFRFLRHTSACSRQRRRRRVTPSLCKGLSRKRGALLRLDHRRRDVYTGRRVLRLTHGAFSASFSRSLESSQPTVLCAPQVAGATQRPLFLPRRGLLVLLQTVVPYALQRERCVSPHCWSCDCLYLFPHACADTMSLQATGC